MLKSEVWRERIFAATLPIRAVVLVAIGAVVLLCAAVYAVQHPTYAIFAMGAIIMALAVITRRDEVAVVLIIATHLYVDWYLGYEYIGPLMALGLLVVFFLSRSPQTLQYSWARPRALWLWALFLMLTIYPTIQGATTSNDLLYYYPNVIVGALLFFWLGMIVAQDRVRLHNLFNLLAGLGTVLAIHTLVQAMTGITLLGSAHVNSYIIQENGDLMGGTVQRYGSFLMNPDWNGTFFGIAFFLPLGLFVVSTSFVAKLLYVIEMFLMVAALLATYSIGGWLGAFAGLLVFIFCVGRWRYRIFTGFVVVIVALIVLVIFPSQTQLEMQHATNPAVLSLRNGAWQTALRVIEAYPLTGIGLGMTTYLLQSEPYRVLAQFVPLAHPHDSYLELGAMAGLPVLFVFIANLLFALWQAWRNWLQADTKLRTLIGCGLACTIALTINSVSINGWTLPPLAAIVWLILGACASPLIIKQRLMEVSQEQHA